MVDGQRNDGMDPRWTMRLISIERLDRDDEDVGEDFYDVVFELSGLGVSGTLSALVTDPASEETVITEALEQLQGGLETFVRVVGQRKGAERIESMEE